MRDGPDRGLRWDQVAADRALDFFGYLRLPADGEIDGKPFTPEPFQAFIIGCLFGWKGSDGQRRFRTAYIEVGKGNGKTPLAAGVGLYGLVADGEAGAEVYNAATTREQAGLSFRDAKRMAESSPALRSILTIGLHNIAFLRTDSFMRPVSSEHKGLDGKRPHMALIDEVHEHPGPLVVDKMRAGTKSRRQALIFEITNSGYDRLTVCWQHHDYSTKILEGVLHDDAWFAYVCQLDACPKCAGEGQTQPTEACPDCDDWRDERVWLKANPGLDSILPRKYLREQVHEAQGMPSKEGIVKRLNFCLWTEGVTRAIPMDRWDACAGPIDMELLKGQECYGGLDIGAISDFTALVLLFAHDDAEVVEVTGPLPHFKDDTSAGTAPSESEEQAPAPTITRRSYTLLPFFWLPERPVRRDERMAPIIDAWRKAGLVKTTPGEVVDYGVVLDDIVKLGETYQLRELCLDFGFQGNWLGGQLAAHFGKAVYTIRQGIVSMNVPFRELLELLITKRLHHANHPTMRWMASNTASEERGGLIKPSKDASTEKIDGITAAVMAMARAMTHGAADWYTPGCLRS